MTPPLPAAFDNRVSRDLGVDIPIVQAPMGWIARSQLASAVSNAGGLGIIETSSGELDVVKDEIRKMRDLTDKPFGVNIAQAFVRDPAIVDFVVEQNVRFVTTSAGSPAKFIAPLKAAGITGIGHDRRVRGRPVRRRHASRGRAHPRARLRQGRLQAVDEGARRPDRACAACARHPPR